MNGSNPWLVEVWFDGYRWCATLGGSFLGNFKTKDDAFAYAMREKYRIAGIKE